MVGDNRGQVSFEYLLIFSISLIILIVFTLPMVNQSMETAFDVYDSINVKSDLSKIASAINNVYGEGQGSKQTVNIHTAKSFKVNIAGDCLYSNLNLKDTNKMIKVSCRSNLKTSSIYVHEGENTIVVEWPINSEKMLIYSQF